MVDDLGSADTFVQCCKDPFANYDVSHAMVYGSKDVASRYFQLILANLDDIAQVHHGCRVIANAWLLDPMVYGYRQPLIGKLSIYFSTLPALSRSSSAFRRATRTLVLRIFTDACEGICLSG